MMNNREIARVRINEVVRVIRILQDKKMGICPKRISWYANPKIVPAEYIKNLDLKFILKNLDRDNLANLIDENGETIKYALYAWSEKRSEIKFAAFKEVVDMLFENDIDITPKNINNASEGRFCSSYHATEKGKAYYRMKKEEQIQKRNNAQKNEIRFEQQRVAYCKNLIDSFVERNSKLTYGNLDLFIKKDKVVTIDFFKNNKEVNDYLKEKQAEMRTANKTSASFDKKCEKKTTELSSIQVEYVLDVINYIIQENCEGDISFEKIMELISQGYSAKEFTLEAIKANKTIVDYIDSKNISLQEKAILNKVKAAILDMQKHNLIVNTFTVLNRCKLPASYLESHEDVLQLIRDNRN